jgi:hypothetical protein
VLVIVINFYHFYYFPPKSGIKENIVIHIVGVATCIDRRTQIVSQRKLLRKFLDLGTLYN